MGRLRSLGPYLDRQLFNITGGQTGREERLAASGYASGQSPLPTHLFMQENVTERLHSHGEGSTKATGVVNAVTHGGNPVPPVATRWMEAVTEISSTSWVAQRSATQHKSVLLTYLSRAANVRDDEKVGVVGRPIQFPLWLMATVTCSSLAVVTLAA